MDYVFYFVDTETTGLDSRINDVIELSALRMTDGVQKTWTMKPTNLETIDIGALRVNGHKMEDLRGETKYGRDTYPDPSKIIIDVENWIMEDGVPTEQRVLIGQNVSFDREFLTQLWTKCNSKDSFPFGRRYLDTMIIEMFLNLCQGKMAEGYSLSNLVKKYGLKNEKAHSAAADTKVTKEVFEKQIEFFKTVLAKQ